MVMSRLPVNAFVHKKDAPDLPLDYLELWDCFSADIEATELTNIRSLRVDAMLKNGKKHPGEYRFTFSWKGNPLSELPGESGFKLGHFLQLDSGNYAILPNNRIAWKEPSFIVKPFPDKPDFLTNSHTWRCETRGKWVTSDDDRVFYDITMEKEK